MADMVDCPLGDEDAAGDVTETDGDGGNIAAGLREIDGADEISSSESLSGTAFEPQACPAKTNSALPISSNRRLRLRFESGALADGTSGHISVSCIKLATQR